jgi:23S rRNA (adenine2503-C2)-methyltransferase
MEDIYGLTIEEMEEYFLSLGSKAFHAKQLFSWLYEKRIEDYKDITDIKKDLVEVIAKEYSFDRLKIVDVQEDVDVNKYLFELSDGEHIEAVLMRHDYGNSICVSSQVGCNMGCKFCESGRRKKVRNLEVHEMVLQILMIEKELGMRISHVVVMGIGEPFDNYDNLIKFLKIINHPKGMAIGARHITVSTSGIAPKIVEYSKEGIQVNLAISLHASNDETRNKLMPINKAYPLNKLFDAIREYCVNADRRVTIEYILLAGVNDTPEHARELTKTLANTPCKINLIPFNPHEGSEFKKPSKKAIDEFYQILINKGFTVVTRKTRGDDIQAACGQLAGEVKNKANKIASFSRKDM